MTDLSAQAAELLKREYASGGTSVTNCLKHMDKSLLERPLDCQLCNADVRNALSRAIAINGWLNEWKDDAARVFSLLAAAPTVSGPCGHPTMDSAA